jgi:hypothetical protein
MKVPEYGISIFLYLTYLVVFITSVVFYAGLPLETRRKSGYITGITLSGASFIGFNIYFFHKLIKHVQRKKIVRYN